MSTVNPKVTAATFSAAVTGLIVSSSAEIRFVERMSDVTRGFLAVVVLGVVTFCAGYFTSSDGGGAHRA